MHKSSMLRMEWFVKNILDKTNASKILDVGSYDVSGTYREFFPSSKYIYFGLDMVHGPNVDIVPTFPYSWDNLDDGSFDAVISGQAFEHIEFFWVTMAEMARVLRPGGMICIVAPRGFSRHRYPVDCYRFDADGMVALARWCGLKVLHASSNAAPQNADPEWYSDDEADSFLIAKKPESWEGIVDPRKYVFHIPDIDELSKFDSNKFFTEHKDINKSYKPNKDDKTINKCKKR